MATFKVKNGFANRGKKSEDAMSKFLGMWTANPLRPGHREANRLVDTKAAGRIIKSAAADFEYFCNLPHGTYHGLIEVKETEHEYRLARDKVPQLPRLRKRTNCGGVCLVAIFHSTLKVWRVVDAPYLADTGDKGSWNISNVAAYSDLATALSEACPEVFS
jgi:hypothetical protein